MRLRNLFETQGEEVAIIFGRFNPPHKGHRAAWELASRSPIWLVGTNKSTQGPKDPLPFDVKVEAMKTIWPEVEGHIVAETSWLTLASRVYNQYPNATLLCLTDEDWVTKTIVQYNGKEGAHGFYNFKKIEQKPTPRLSSATALRDAVSKGDRDAFTQAAGVDADTPIAGKPFFDLVAEYLLPYANAPKKAPAKKKKESAVSESYLGSMLPWPEIVNKVNSAMKATGWKGQRKDDDSYMFSTAGRLDDEEYFIIISNVGRGYFEYALGTMEEGDPYIGEKEFLPMTLASVSELMDAIRDGFGLNESVTEAKDPCWKGYKQIGMKKKGSKQVPNCVPKESIEIDEGALSTDVAHALKRYGEHVKNNIFVDLGKLFSNVKYSQALQTISTLSPEQKKIALKIIARAGGLLGQKLANTVEETYDGNGFYETYGDIEETLEEAEYQGRKVQLGKPMQGDVKKFKVYVKDPTTGNIKKVNFGDPDMKIKAYDPDRRRSFRARHNCDNPGPKTKARYWSCRKW